jgi:hypothetical protein
MLNFAKNKKNKTVNEKITFFSFHYDQFSEYKFCPTSRAKW